MKKVLGILAIVVVVVVVFGLLSSCGGKAIRTCDDLAPHIIEMSKKERGPLHAKILKLYEIKGPFNAEILKLAEIKKSDTRYAKRVLNCIATAWTDRSDEAPISFYLEEDVDGDRFIGYQM